MDSEDIVEFFDAHGWVVLRQVVAPGHVAELAAAFDSVLTPSRAAALPQSAGIPHLVEPWRRHPAFVGWLRAAVPFAAAARCLGTPRVQLLQDDLLLKRPGADDTLAWHQDASYLSALEPLRSVSIRLALDQENPESGCMWVLDASHRWGVVTVARADATRVEDALVDAPPEVRAAAQRPIELAPGDISIHDAFTFHASHANRSSVPRRTLVTRVVSSESRLVRERLAPSFAAHVAMTRDGHLDPARFPLLPLDVAGR